MIYVYIYMICVYIYIYIYIYDMYIYIWYVYIYIWYMYIYDMCIYIYDISIYMICIYICDMYIYMICIYMICIYIWYVYIWYVYIWYVYIYDMYIYIYDICVYIYIWYVYIYDMYIYIYDMYIYIWYMYIYIWYVYIYMIYSMISHMYNPLKQHPVDQSFLVSIWWMIMILVDSYSYSWGRGQDVKNFKKQKRFWMGMGIEPRKKMSTSKPWSNVQQLRCYWSAGAHLVLNCRHGVCCHIFLKVFALRGSMTCQISPTKKRQGFTFHGCQFWAPKLLNKATTQPNGRFSMDNIWSQTHSQHGWFHHMKPSFSYKFSVRRRKAIHIHIDTCVYIPL